MGLACSLHRATESDIARLLADPNAVGDFLDPHDGRAPRVREVRPKGLLGWLLRLTPITITEVDPESSADGEFPPADPDKSIDVEKAWHGLHFLLTGTADGGDEPGCYLIQGGEDLDDEGQTRALRPDQVRRFAELLSSLTPAELARRYDPVRMATLKIYPESIWSRPSKRGDSPLAWLTSSFVDVQQFINKIAASGDGVIIDIS